MAITIIDENGNIKATLLSPTEYHQFLKFLAGRGPYPDMTFYKSRKLMGMDVVVCDRIG